MSLIEANNENEILTEECTHEVVKNGFCVQCAIQIEEDQLCYKDRGIRTLSRASVKVTRCPENDLRTIVSKSNLKDYLTSEEQQKVSEQAIEVFNHLKHFYNLPVQKDSRSKKHVGSTRMYILTVCVYHGLKHTVIPEIWPELLAELTNLDANHLVSRLRMFQLFERKWKTVHIQTEQNIVHFIGLRILKLSVDENKTFWEIIKRYLIITNRYNLVHNIVFSACYKAKLDNQWSDSFWNRLCENLYLDNSKFSRITDKIRRKGGTRNAALPYPQATVIPQWYTDEEISTDSECSMSPVSPGNINDLC